MPKRCYLFISKPEHVAKHVLLRFITTAFCLAAFLMALFYLVPDAQAAPGTEPPGLDEGKQTLPPPVKLSAKMEEGEPLPFMEEGRALPVPDAKEIIQETPPPAETSLHAVPRAKMVHEGLQQADDANQSVPQAEKDLRGPPSPQAKAAPIGKSVSEAAQQLNGAIRETLEQAQVLQQTEGRTRPTHDVMLILPIRGTKGEVLDKKIHTEKTMDQTQRKRDLPAVAKSHHQQQDHTESSANLDGAIFKESPPSPLPHVPENKPSTGSTPAVLPAAPTNGMENGKPGAKKGSAGSSSSAERGGVTHLSWTLFYGAIFAHLEEASNRFAWTLWQREVRSKDQWSQPPPSPPPEVHLPLCA